MTINPLSQRTQRTMRLLRSYGIEPHLFSAVRSLGSSEMDKVRSNMQSQREVYDTIARSDGSPDEYVFVFEDDVMLAPEVRPEQVVPLLRCGAALSLRRSLPVFYAGGCNPRDMSGVPLRDQHRAAEFVDSATLVRTRCAHAYAVRRSDAAMLRQLADDHPDRGAGTFMHISGADRSYYMDVQLDYLASQRGGFYLLAAKAKAPHELSHRGLFYQDRTTFPSDIKLANSTLLAGSTRLSQTQPKHRRRRKLPFTVAT
jgi:hypothetical protein